MWELSEGSKYEHETGRIDVAVKKQQYYASIHSAAGLRWRWTSLRLKDLRGLSGTFTIAQKGPEKTKRFWDSRISLSPRWHSSSGDTPTASSAQRVRGRRDEGEPKSCNWHKAAGTQQADALIGNELNCSFIKNNNSNTHSLEISLSKWIQMWCKSSSCCRLERLHTVLPKHNMHVTFRGRANRKREVCSSLRSPTADGWVFSALSLSLSVKREPWRLRYAIANSGGLASSPDDPAHATVCRGYSRDFTPALYFLLYYQKPIKFHLTSQCRFRAECRVSKKR